jgi:GNAT superfamily N-acetyltransferase
MPEIEIRPAVPEDIDVLTKIDHSYTSDHVWQMDPQFASGQTGAVFREVRLPREAKVVVAVLSGEPVGYTSLVENMMPITTWVMDLAVLPKLRRQGIGSALMLAALDWTGAQTKSQRLILGMQTKNFPGINMAQRLGFDYCGYIDHFYTNRDIAIFFTKWII